MNMDAECQERLVIMPEFLTALSDLPRREGRKVIDAVRLLMRNPDDPRLCRERLEGRGVGLQSIRAAGSCRIIFAGRRAIVIRYVGSAEQAHRFVGRAAAEATAMAESPIAHQLHACADPLQVFASEYASESPSCGAQISLDSLARLALRVRRYLPLTHLLLSRGPEIGSMAMRFPGIETALARPLPKSARRLKKWWANDPGRIHASSWLAIGWEIASVDLRAERVVFIRSAGVPTANSAGGTPSLRDFTSCGADKR